MASFLHFGRGLWFLILCVIASTINISSAISCDSFHYLSNAGVCSACPHNTRRYPNSISDLDSTSVTQCICKKDYFSLNTTSCSECVSGGKCEGGHQQPYPKEGFYGHQTTDIPIFMPCMNQYACLGGKNFSCSEGWEGVLCAQPVDGFFKFGISSVECPHASGTSLRLGTRKTELTVICILLSTSVCLWILLYVSKTSSKLWHLLQLLALASKINHVHWPIIQHNFFIVLSHTVLLDFRPLARLLVGCDTGVSGGDMLEVMLGIGPTAVATVGVVIWTAKSQDLNRLTSLRAALILVLTSLEMFACRTFPDRVERLYSDPEVVCWEGVHKTAVLVAGIFLILWGSLLVLLYLRERRSHSRTTNDVTIELIDVFVLYGLAACVVFGTDQPSEVALMFVVASTARAASMRHPLLSPVSATADVWIYTAVAVFSLSTFALLFAPSFDLKQHHYRSNMLTYVPLFVWIIPLLLVMWELPKKWRDGMYLKFESVVATTSSNTLKKWETVQLVVVKNHSTKRLTHSHPRLMITVMKSKGGTELLKTNGRINSRVVALNTASLQPNNTNFLTYSFDTILSTAMFRVQVLDVTSGGEDVVIAVGFFSMSLLTEGETTQVVPLKLPGTQKPFGSSTISCSYGIPGELLAIRERSSRNPLTAIMRSLCVSDSRLPIDHNRTPLYPSVVCRFASRPQRLPQDFELLRCFADCVEATSQEADRGNFSAVSNLLVNHVDPRFLDLIVQECETEAHRQSIHQLFILLAKCRQCRGSHVLPFHNVFVVDWILRCRDGQLEKGCASLAQLTASGGRFPIPSFMKQPPTTQDRPGSIELGRLPSPKRQQTPQLPQQRPASTSPPQPQRSVAPTLASQQRSVAPTQSPSPLPPPDDPSPSLQPALSSVTSPLRQSSQSSLSNSEQRPDGQGSGGKGDSGRGGKGENGKGAGKGESGKGRGESGGGGANTATRIEVGARSSVMEAQWEEALEGFVSFIFGKAEEPQDPDEATL